MERGQLGTSFQQRAIFVWDGLVAELPDSWMVKGLEQFACYTSRWDKAVGYWKLNERVIAMMWSLFARTEYRIDMAVTTRGPEFTLAVTKLVEARNLPVHYVFSELPEDLGRLLPSMPDVTHVYYGRDSQRWAYGPQGVCIHTDEPMSL